MTLQNEVWKLNVHNTSGLRHKPNAHSVSVLKKVRSWSS